MILHQERALFPNLDVASNIFIANLPRQMPGVIHSHDLGRRARLALERVGLSHIRPSRKVGSLSPGEQQLVEIARSLTRRADILVFDEPTSSLTSQEIERLFPIIRELKGQGVGILYVTHRLDEVFVIYDRVTVLRDGKRIVTVAVEEVDRHSLVQMILGREISEMYQREFQSPGPTVLRVEGLPRGTTFRNISFELHRGEVLGITGLLGSGRTELARAIFGLDPFDSGKIWIDGAEVRIRCPEDAIKHGLDFITEDKHKEGLILEKPIVDNIVLASLPAFANRLGWMQPRKEQQAAKRQREKLRIVTPSVKRLVKYLSGGNKQKVVLGKWLQTAPRIYILDEPTRGIDVGAKAEVHRIISGLAREGAGIILISSEIPEIVRIMNEPTTIEEPPAALPHRLTLAWAQKPLQFALRYGIYLVFLGLCAAIAAASPVFLTVRNLSNVLLQSAAIGIIAVRMTFVIIARGIDVSVGAIVALGSAVGVAAMKLSGQPWCVGLLLMWVPWSAMSMASRQPNCACRPSL